MRAVIEELRAAQRAVDAVDEAISADLGVNRTDARCLDVLEQEGAVTAGRLAERAGLTSGAITGVLDRLERAGYARRRRDDRDRRRILIELTDEFQARSRELYAALGGEGQRELARFSEDELDTIVDFLRRSRELNERHLARLRGGKLQRPGR